MRLLRACLAAAIALAPQAALACGGMVSPEGQAEMLGFEALLRWDHGNEELEVSIGYQTRGEEELGWLMPLPSVPEITEGNGELISEALAITEPPIADEGSGDEGAGAPPAVGGAPGVDVLSRDEVGNLKFVTLGAKSANDVTRWMTKHGFSFHDRQEPVIQGYLDRGWVVVAAKFISPDFASLVPVNFRFVSQEIVYPLEITGAGHEKEDLDVQLFVLSPFRPTSTTYPETIVQPDPQSGFDSPKKKLELRYSAPLGDQADRMAASPDTWLTRYEGNLRVEDLTQDLVLAPSEEQTPIDYSNIGEEDDVIVWVRRIGVVLVAVVLAIWITRGMARRRRSAEAPKMPGPGSTA